MKKKSFFISDCHRMLIQATELNAYPCTLRSHLHHQTSSPNIALSQELDGYSKFKLNRMPARVTNFDKNGL